MATSKVTYLGDLRTSSIHLASGSEIISLFSVFTSSESFTAAFTAGLKAGLNDRVSNFKWDCN